MLKSTSPVPHMHLGYGILAAWLVLVIMGLMMSISAPSVLAQERFGDALFFFKRQALFTVLSAASLLVLMHIPYRIWLYPRVVQGLFAGTTGTLVLVLFLPPIREVHRWIRLGPLSFQPSELAKLALVLYIAYQAHRLGRQQFLHPFHGLLSISLVTLIWSGFILKEPDLGNAVLLFLLAGSLLFLGRIPIRYLALPFLLLGLLFGFLVWTNHIPAYWMNRIHAYLNPEAYAQTSAYQQNQAIIALGHGGLTGVGYGQSLQKLYYLPEPQTDYVYAIVGEEFGFMGTMGLLAAYLWIVMAGLVIGWRTKDFGGQMMAFGLSAWIAWQALGNISVVVGLLPSKGLVLPFVSYGGTSLWVHTLGVGWLLSVDRFHRNPFPWLLPEYEGPSPALTSRTT